MPSVRSTTGCLAIVIAVLAVVSLDAQRGRGGGRGGGRGRGGIALMTLTIPAWTDGAMIPAVNAQDGAERSPAISWSNAPEGTASFVLVVHDVDAPAGGSDRLHWLVWNIPPTSVGLPEGLTQGPQLDDGIRQISVSGAYYRGPAAVPDEPPHHYLFELFAVDTLINVGAPGESPDGTRTAVMSAIEGHVLARATYVGRY